MGGKGNNYDKASIFAENEEGFDALSRILDDERDERNQRSLVKQRGNEDREGVDR